MTSSEASRIVGRALTLNEPDIDSFEEAVEDQVERLRVQAEARRRFAAENDPHRDQDVDHGSLGEVLARPDDEPFRIERLLPAGGRMLLSAQAKTGKTRTLTDLAAALLTGRPFLGTLPVRPIDGNVVFVNLEVTGRQIARWCHEAGVPHDRLHLVNLRGTRNLFADDEGREELINIIRRASGQVLLVDPFGRAFTGSNQNDAAEVAPWLVALDSLAERAGCTEVALTAHAGWNGDRTRGSSALEDWPDVIVTMTKDEIGHRYLRAVGRDVDLDEDRVAFDPTSGRLTLTGSGNRTQATGHAADVALARFLADNPASSGRHIESALMLNHARKTIREALQRGAVMGWILTEPGEKNSTLHSIKPGSAPPGTAPGLQPIDLTPDPEQTAMLERLAGGEPVRRSAPANSGEQPAEASAPVRRSAPANSSPSSAPPPLRGRTGEHTEHDDLEPANGAQKPAAAARTESTRT